MAQSPQTKLSSADRDPNEGEGAFILLMALVPATFIGILVLILVVNP